MHDRFTRDLGNESPENRYHANNKRNMNVTLKTKESGKEMTCGCCRTTEGQKQAHEMDHLLILVETNFTATLNNFELHIL